LLKKAESLYVIDRTTKGGITSFYATIDFKEIVLLQEKDVPYTLADWFYDKDMQRYLLGKFLRRKPLKNFRQDNNIYYTFIRSNKEEVIGLRIAYLNSSIGISFNPDAWSSAFIVLEKVTPTKSEAVKEVIVKHASTIEHIPRYENNPKHHLHVDGEKVSPMDLSEADAWKVLLCAVKLPDMDELYNFHNGYFYIFRPHHTIESHGISIFHGYRVVDLKAKNKTKILKALLDTSRIDQKIYDEKIK